MIDQMQRYQPEKNTGLQGIMMCQVYLVEANTVY